MPQVELLKLLDGKWEDGTRPKDLFTQHISNAPAKYVEVVLAGLVSESKKVQNGCAELASLLSSAKPALLYPHVDVFQKNLTAKEPILRWEAACTLGNLAQIDDSGQIRASVDHLLGFLRDKSIVLQGHSVRALAKIVKKFPDLGPRVLQEMLHVRGAFPGNRIGFIVEAMEAFVTNAKLRPEVIAFVEPYTHSDIASVATKARKVMKSVPNTDGTKKEASASKNRASRVRGAK